MEIKTIAVIGSGVMGAGIAAHIANCGFEVLLLDIVPDKAADRNIIAKQAIEKLLESNPPAFTVNENSERITPGNLQDDLAELENIDWIIEVIVEKLEVKQNLYRTLDKYRKSGSIVSSNTSTLPLKNLISGMSKKFQEDFLITHFFNPPRYMKLIELITGSKTKKDNIKIIREFLDVKLGKGVVDCKDTPGFIANRIGCFWLEVGLNEAFNLGISVEDADTSVGKPAGIPKTGVMGLWDLIGIDLMPLIAKSLITALPKNDDFCKIYKLHDQIKKMINEGYIGRKGKGGFYRITKNSDKIVKEVLDLKTGNYITQKGPNPDYLKMSFTDLVDHNSIGGKYLRKVMLQTLSYAAKLVPEISNNIVGIDKAMRLGYNWQHGPFELIDLLGAKKFANILRQEKMEVPDIIQKLGDHKFYQQDKFFTTKANYTKIKKEIGIITLKETTKKVILASEAAELIDVGDKVACFNFKTKMNVASPEALEILNESLDLVGKNYKALVIGNDSANFCVGGNLDFMLECAHKGDLKKLSEYIKYGQMTMMKIKYSEVPIVSAHRGLALGGGTEILLHSAYVISEIEAISGLVESRVGLIPAWGGTKEMVLRNIMRGDNSILKSFEVILRGNKIIAQNMDMNFMMADHEIIANDKRVLFEAKSKSLHLANNYHRKQIVSRIKISPTKIRELLELSLKNMSNLAPHDYVIAGKVINVFSGNSYQENITISEEDILDIELEMFLSLAASAATKARIEYMLKTGKNLNN